MRRDFHRFWRHLLDHVGAMPLLHAPVQYGQRIAAFVVYLLHYQLLPEALPASKWFPKGNAPLTLATQDTVNLSEKRSNTNTSPKGPSRWERLAPGSTAAVRQVVATIDGRAPSRRQVYYQ